MNDSDNERPERPAYVQPKVVDYGSLQDLTASGGNSFVDTPVGTPTTNITASSTP